uniref:Protein kinase-like domain, phloem protein 2-like protein n=1 Tax=Tanacetum cinerariifolium TaxID=118510 RepID=A0A6L2MBX1_TANCI|nr:protein kinase-like domain, phloem protein 2-like protein [Tanacetum cinerariifolium]
MIDLRDIRIATNNFDEEYIIGSGGYCTAYKAKLDVCDIKNISKIEGNNKCELPKRSATVAIKRPRRDSHKIICVVALKIMMKVIETVILISVVVVSFMVTVDQLHM